MPIDKLVRQIIGAHLRGASASFLVYTEQILKADRPRRPEDWKELIKILRLIFQEGRENPTPETLKISRTAEDIIRAYEIMQDAGRYRRR